MNQVLVNGFMIFTDTLSSGTLSHSHFVPFQLEVILTTVPGLLVAKQNKAKQKLKDPSVGEKLKKKTARN